MTSSSPRRNVTVRVTHRAGRFCAVAANVLTGDIARCDRPLPDVAERAAIAALLDPTGASEVLDARAA